MSYEGLKDQKDNMEGTYSYEDALSEKEQISSLSKCCTKSVAVIESLTKECIRIEKENRELIRERDRKAAQVQDLDMRMRPIKEELEIFKSSRLFKIMTKIWNIESFLLPAGSRRRSFVSACCRGAMYRVQTAGGLHTKCVRKKGSGIKQKSFLLCRTHKRIGKRHRQRRSHTRNLQNTTNENRHGIKTQNGIEVCGGIKPDECSRSGIEAYSRLEFEFQENPVVSIIIPVYNEFSYTYQCLDAVKKNTGDVSYEIILADDCSSDLTSEIEKIVSGITVIRSAENKRFVRNCNYAAQAARGRYILFLNNDTQVQAEWLKPLVMLMEHSRDIGLAGSKLVYADGSLQEAGGIIWRDASAWNYGRGQNADCPEYNYVKDADYVSGASMMIRKSLWEEIGGFDERFAPAYYEDSDLAFEVRKHGYRVVYQPESVVKHFEGISNGISLSAGVKKNQAINRTKMELKWKDELQFHSINGQEIFRARDRSWNKKIVLFVSPHVPEYDKDAESYRVYLYMKVLNQKGFHIKMIAGDFCRRKTYSLHLEQMGIEVLYGSNYKERIFDWIDLNRLDLDYVFLVGQSAVCKYMEYFYQRTDAKLACCSWSSRQAAYLRDEKSAGMADIIYCFSKKEAEQLRSIYTYAEIHVLPDMQGGLDDAGRSDEAALWRTLKEDFL